MYLTCVPNLYKFTGKCGALFSSLGLTGVVWRDCHDNQRFSAVTKELIYETEFLRKGNNNNIIGRCKKFFSMMHCSCNIDVISYILYQDTKNQTVLYQRK